MGIIIATTVFIILIVCIVLFASKRFSPIPYFPSNHRDMPLIIDSLAVEKTQGVIDLGAGDGVVIFEAAKKAAEQNLKTKFIAVEINPILIMVLNIRKFMHPNKKNIRIVWGDLFKMNLKHLTHDFFLSREALAKWEHLTFYLYISPWFLDKVGKKILREVPYAKIVSYMYPIGFLKDKEKIIQGKNKVFVYTHA